MSLLKSLAIIVFFLLGIALIYAGLFPQAIIQCPSFCEWWDVVCLATRNACFTNRALIGYGLLLFGAIVLILDIILVMFHE